MGAGNVDIHREEFVHLVDLSHDRVLVAWGAFWFRRDEAGGRWNILDDSELQETVGRRKSIGHGAEPFGEAQVEVLDAGGQVVAEARTADKSAASASRNSARTSARPLWRVERSLRLRRY